MTDYEDENYYFFGTYAQYTAEYNPEHVPIGFRPDDAPDDWEAPKQVPPSYKSWHKAPLVALSIPPEDPEPLKRIRPLLRELQTTLVARLNLRFVPTLYLTLMPRVQGDLNGWDSQKKRKEFLARHTHPGVGIWKEKDKHGNWKYDQTSAATLRFDRTWQATIHFDPMVFSADKWSEHLSEYTLHAFYGDELHSLSFQDIHDACPLIGVLIDPGFVSCGGCAYNDVFCRTRFVREAFDEISPEILDHTLWFRERGYDSGAMSLRADVSRCKAFDEIDSDVLPRVDVPGWYRASSQAAGSTGRRNGDVSSLRFDWKRVRNETVKKRRAAQKGAETRKKHDAVCGYGDDACVLRQYDCMAWKSYSRKCTHRRQHEEELNEEALARFPEMGQKTPVIDIQRASLLAMNTFEYISSDTGHILTGTHCGALRPRGKGDVLWRIKIGPQRDTTLVSFPSYAEMRRWFRRWAPWELENIDETDERAPSVEISDLMRCVFYATQNMTSISVGGGFGSTSHRVTCYDPVLGKKDDGTLFVKAVTARGNGYSLGHIKSMVDYWHTAHQGFTRAGGILPA